MVFSTNQVRHLYVGKSVKDSTATLTEAGDIKVKVLPKELKKTIYFEAMGAENVLKSDYIPVDSITYVKARKASEQATSMKKVVVALDSTVNGGLPIAGQDYILRINLRQFYGMSDQDQYFKDAAVHAKKGMTAVEFYKEMVTALNQSFSREIGATIKSNPYLAFSSDSNGIVIEEKPQTQDWHLGVGALERVYFDVVPTTVYDGTDDLIWSKPEVKVSDTKVGNGRKIADLEYFLLGERGDQYRKIGWPNDIETKGVVDTTGKTDYDVLDIHYSFSDTGVNSYKTEKEITIVVPSAGEKDFTVMNELIKKFNTATGLSVEELKDTASAEPGIGG